jgi:hypothetical protein
MKVPTIEIRLLKARMNVAEDCLKFMSMNPIFRSNSQEDEQMMYYCQMRMVWPSMLYFTDQESLARKMIKSSIEMKKVAQLRKVNQKLMKLNQISELPVCHF